MPKSGRRKCVLVDPRIITSIRQLVVVVRDVQTFRFGCSTNNTEKERRELCHFCTEWIDEIRFYFARKGRKERRQRIRRIIDIILCTRSNLSTWKEKQVIHTGDSFGEMHLSWSEREREQTKERYNHIAYYRNRNEWRLPYSLVSLAGER